MTARVTTEREERTRFLRALRIQLAAPLAAVDAELQRLTGAAPETEPGCPCCGSTEHQAEAGDVMVCGEAGCGANYRGAEVLT